MNQPYSQYGAPYSYQQPQHTYSPYNPYPPPQQQQQQQQQHQQPLAHHQQAQPQQQQQQQLPVLHQQQHQGQAQQLHHAQPAQSQNHLLRPFRAGSTPNQQQQSSPQQQTPFEQPLRQQANRTQASAPSYRRNVRGANAGRNGISPQPATPGPGPGAPPPDPVSPDHHLEQALMSALQEPEGNGRQDTQNNDDDDDDDDQDQTQQGPGDDNEPIFNLPPPPEAIYPDEAELEKAIHAWSLEHGYELVRRASKKNAAGQLYKRYYHCSKHGKIANTGKLTDKTRVRVNRKSNRMGCPMSLAAVAVDPSNPGGEWQIRLRKTHHNHGPLDAVTLAGHRRRARMGGVEKAVDGLFAIGTPTTQVLQFLQRTNPNGLFTRTDVANMKLKYKKYGTCVKEDDNRKTVLGVPSACINCRSRKRKCDSVRPICGACVSNRLECRYDHEGGPNPAQQQAARTQQPDPHQHDDDDDTSMLPSTGPAAPEPGPAANGGPQQQNNMSNARAQQQILADLQRFQTEHVRPSRLTLQSSSVEILSHSSCGNGDSYKNVPMLYLITDWDAYSSGMIEAAMKENTYDVLMGTKTEPAKPNDDCDVEEWNEYIKQVAIFSRRNAALLGALWGTLAPPFRLRVQGYRNANAVWRTLEDACQPRGSHEALKLYTELTNTTLHSSGGLRDYVTRLENAYEKLSRLKLQQLRRGGGLQPNAPPSAYNADNVFPEDQVTFLFLKNLGPEYERWAENLCMTSNIGGFGSGPKLSFKDVARRAIEAEAIGKRQSR